MPWDQRNRLPHSNIEENVFSPRDKDLKTISLPASVVISSFGKTVVGCSSAAELMALISAYTSPTEYIKATSTTLSSSEMNLSIINNYGQAAVNVIVLLPYAAARLESTFVIMTAQAGNVYAIKAQVTDKIYLDGSAGADGGLIYIVPTVGSSIRVYSVQTGASSYDWFAVTESGTWLAGAIPTRVTTTGDRRVTTGADVRIAA